MQRDLPPDRLARKCTSTASRHTQNGQLLPLNSQMTKEQLLVHPKDLNPVPKSLVFKS